MVTPTPFISFHAYPSIVSRHASTALSGNIHLQYLLGCIGVHPPAVPAQSLLAQFAGLASSSSTRTILWHIHTSSYLPSYPIKRVLVRGIVLVVIQFLKLYTGHAAPLGIPCQPFSRLRTYFPHVNHLCFRSHYSSHGACFTLHSFRCADIHRPALLPHDRRD